jgi:hypothetical protein
VFPTQPSGREPVAQPDDGDAGGLIPDALAAIDDGVADWSARRRRLRVGEG